MAQYTQAWKLYDDYPENNYGMDSTKSIELPPRNLSQRWRRYSHDAKRRVFERFSKWCPKGSATSNLFIYLKTDQSFAEFVLKSVIGFFGGIVLTYLCFMFFVFQLSISLIHATIISSVIGVLLTFGLAFSHRIRCLVFLLIPQLFSRVGRYTLTCYALVLILTGPATNTLKNSEVLSESMACSQEQIKTDVKQITASMNKPFNAMRDSIKVMIGRLNEIAYKVNGVLAKINRVVNSVVDILQSSYSWLKSVVVKCNTKFGTPIEHCLRVLKDGSSKYKAILPNTSSIFKTVCSAVNSNSKICKVAEFTEESIAATVKRKLNTFTSRVQAMFFVKIHMHHSLTFNTNTSRTPSQVTAGIVTEIRNRADPLLTWLSWSSCVTSLFLLLIIFRAKYYQHMFETRSRFDNRYITKELSDLDLQRLHEGRETVLPLNRRELAKYVTTASFRLVPSERVHLTRSIVFMAITTFKLMIHMVADYSLYWVLMTIRYHGKRQTRLPVGPTDAGIHITGTGLVADLFRSIFKALTIPLLILPPPTTCLPDPYPPDLQRYTQIGVLIFLLWFFALFEPYGLRLRHLIMGHYQPERAKARAVWLYNHILRTRGSFMKFARRKLHKEYKYLPNEELTLRHWLNSHLPFRWLRYIFGILPKAPKCLLCDAKEDESNSSTQVIRCETENCPGAFCVSCFSDIGQLCTICLKPVDYGDFSDISLERGSSEDSDDSSSNSDVDDITLRPKPKYFFKPHDSHDCNEKDSLLGNQNLSALSKPRFYSSKKSNNNNDEIPPVNYCEDMDVKDNFNDEYYKTESHHSANLLKPISNLAIGYILKNCLWDNKHTVSYTNTFENDDIVKDNKSNCNEYLKINYGTFKDTPVNGNCTYFHTAAHTKQAAKTNRLKVSRRINIKTCAAIIKNKKTCFKHMKARSNTFKIKRRRSHFQYKQRTKVLCNVIKRKLISFTVCISSSRFEMPSFGVRLTNVFNVKKRSRSARLHKIMKCPKNITPNNASGMTKNRSNNKRILKLTNFKPFKKADNADYANKKCNIFDIQDNKNAQLSRAMNTKQCGNKIYNKKQCYCARRFRKLFSQYARRLTVIFKKHPNSQKVPKKHNLPLLNLTSNYKRRKKHLPKTSSNERTTNTVRNSRKDIEVTRSYRIYTFLKEQDWIKCQFDRDKVPGNKNKTHTKVSENKEVDAIKIQHVEHTNFAKVICDKGQEIPDKNVHHVCTCDEHVCNCDDDCNGCQKSDDDENVEEEIMSNVPEIPQADDNIQCDIKEYNKTNPTYIKTSSYSICHLHLPTLCKSNSRVENKTRSCAKVSCSVKSINISKVKLYISNNFLHFRFRNPISMLKYAFSSQTFCTHKATVPEVKVQDNKKSLDKECAAIPEIKSCSCQYEIMNSMLNSPEIYRLNKQNYPGHSLDAKVQTLNNKCTCASQCMKSANHIRQKNRNKSEHVRKNAETNVNVNDLRYNEANINQNLNDLKRKTELEREDILTNSSKESLESFTMSDTTRTDTTLCSRITIDYVDEQPKIKVRRAAKKLRVNVITKSNQSTVTDKAKLCDASTITNDWWSPIVEKRDIMKNGSNESLYRKKRDKETSRDMSVLVGGRMVTFKSRAQIIPADSSYVLSPSRYLLESQKYYNELFSPKFYSPHMFPTIRANGEKKVNSFKGHLKRINKNIRTKRLDDRRSSGIQLSPGRLSINRTRSDETTSVTRSTS